MNLGIILPLVIYLVFIFGAALFAYVKRSKGDFLTEYYVGNRSMTVLPVKSKPSNHSKQSAVVGCVPVPNAKPGSSITFTAFLSGTSRQLGNP